MSEGSRKLRAFLSEEANDNKVAAYNAVYHAYHRPELCFGDGVQMWDDDSLSRIGEALEIDDDITISEGASSFYVMSEEAFMDPAFDRASFDKGVIRHYPVLAPEPVETEAPGLSSHVVDFGLTFISDADPESEEVLEAEVIAGETEEDPCFDERQHDFGSKERRPGWNEHKRYLPSHCLGSNSFEGEAKEGPRDE